MARPAMVTQGAPRYAPGLLTILGWVWVSWVLVLALQLRAPEIFWLALLSPVLARAMMAQVRRALRGTRLRPQ